MTHFNVTIPNDKISFLKELLANLHLAELEQAVVNALSPAHKAILDQRVENYQDNPATYFASESVQEAMERR